MKSKLATGLLVFMAATTANAGVNEKKMMRTADESIAVELEKTKAACGNTELSAIVSWDKFNSMVLANEEKIKENTDQAKFVFSHAGGRSVSTLEALTKICEDDPDYKAEIATITSIVFEPKEDYDEADSTFSLSNTTLTVLSGHKYQRSYDDFIKPLKALF